MNQDEIEVDPEDEEGRDSFPTSDPPGDWAGADFDPEVADTAVEDADDAVEDADDLVPDPLPEADSPAVADAWEDFDAMEGQAPTG